MNNILWKIVLSCYTKSFSKWPEVFIVDSTSSFKSIAVLYWVHCFYTMDSLKLLYLIVVHFLQARILKNTSINMEYALHVTDATYNPFTDDQIERLHYKTSTRLLAKNGHGSMKPNLNTFILFSSRRSDTVKRPAELIFSRNSQSSFTILHKFITKKPIWRQFYENHRTFRGWGYVKVCFAIE